MGTGSRLRAARSARRVTLADLADDVGVTKGYLSKLENGRATASVALLVRLCSALDVPVGSLFDDVPAGDVVRAGEYPPIDFGGTGQREHLLTPAGERRVQVLRGDIDAGGGSGAEAYELPADVAFVHVLTGELTVAFEHSEPVTLRDGDAFTFDPTRRHSFRASVPTTVLWVLTPGLPTRAPVRPRTPASQRTAPRNPEAANPEAANHEAANHETEDTA